MKRWKRCSACRKKLDLEGRCSKCDIDQMKGEEVVTKEDGGLEDQFVKTESVVDSEEYLKSVPPGWKVTELEVGFGSIIKKFIDPQGKIYMGRIGAVRKLKSQTDRQEEMMILREGLAADAWIQHPLLPEGWWAKPDKVPRNRTRFRFLTEENKWFVGMKKATALLNSGSQYTSHQLENLHQFIAEQATTERC